MVTRIKKDGETYYQCDNCKFFYKLKKLAQKCQDWCDNHNNCSMEITKYAEKV